MSGRHWLECVQSELLRRNLPRQEIARLVAELSDHYSDVMESQAAAGMMPAGSTACVEVSFINNTEEDMSMEASVAERLGSPADIADTAVREFRRRKNLLSRSRLAAFCTFLMLPLPALCLAWIASLAGLALMGKVMDGLGIPDPSKWHADTGLPVIVVNLVMYGIVLAPAAGVAALFGRLAWKTTRKWRWGLAACLLVALATALVTVQATFSELPKKNSASFGIGIGNSMLPWSALGQFVIPWRQEFSYCADRRDR